MTCGTGSKTRAVVCTLQDRKSAEEIHCDMDVKPELEQMCTLAECKPEDFDIGVIITNTVVGISHWRIGPWSAVRYIVFTYIFIQSNLCYEVNSIK